MTDTTEVKQQFLNSLKRGTGEAYLILKSNPTIDFSDLIIIGATTNFAYDQQCEGSRANYIYRLIQKSKQKDKIVKAVLKKLEKRKKDYYGLEQMCDLAVRFYKSGNREAKTSLYNRFEKNNLEGYEFCGQDQIIELDGLNGLLKVAEIVGVNLYKDHEDWEDSWRVDAFQKRNKSISVYEELEKASQSNKYINAYYKSILEHKRTISKRRKFTKFSYELIKEKIDQNKFRYISAERANDLSDEEINKLANDFLIENDRQRLALYLRFFNKRKFPFGYEPIFKLACRKNPRNSRLVSYAMEALKYFSANEIRQYALDKCRTEKNPSDYLNLLVANYKKGDANILTEIANRSDNYDYIHSIVFGLIDIYTTNPTTECKEPLEAIYKKMNCGIHRKDIIKIMLDNNILSDKIFKEMEFDSNDEVRKLYRQKKHK